MAKGASFERTICKKLSLWWTYDSRDDVFWRSSQSGGRATIRHRQGKRTAGSYGDITALDPIGEPLLKLFTIELKRGQSHGEPGDLIDGSGSIEKHLFLASIRQADDAHKRAGSISWLLISKRDRHAACIFFPAWLLSARGPFYGIQSLLIEPPVYRYRVEKEDFIGISLEKFLNSADPESLAKIIAS
jgi:hypothetical protein